MHRKIIGVDLDDVLFHFNESLCAYYNKHHNTNFQRSDIKTYDLDLAWNCPREIAVQTVADFYLSPEHTETKPFPGAQEGINTLKTFGKLHIITSRPETIRNITMEWLNKHFPNTFEEVHFINQYHNTEQRRTKLEVAQELGIDIFIDDSLEHARSVSSIGIPVLLFDAPWNQEAVIGPITRIYSWKDITEHLKKLS